MKLIQDKSKPVRAVERVYAKHSDKIIVEQCHAKGCDINNIVKQFHKTGILPENNKTPIYGDFSNIPSTEEAFDIAHKAQEAFMLLPANLRKLIDNDPSQLSKFMLEEKNYDACVQYGLFDKKPEPEPKTEPVIPEEKPVENKSVTTTKVVAGT